MSRAPELHPWLGGTASLETHTARTAHALSEHAALVAQLTERLRTIVRLREPDKYAECYPADEHLRLIERALDASRDLLQRAESLMATRGVTRGGA